MQSSSAKQFASHPISDITRILFITCPTRVWLITGSRNCITLQLSVVGLSFNTKEKENVITICLCQAKQKASKLKLSTLFSHKEQNKRFFPKTQKGT